MEHLVGLAAPLQVFTAPGLADGDVLGVHPLPVLRAHADGVATALAADDAARAQARDSCRGLGRRHPRGEDITDEGGVGEALLVGQFAEGVDCLLVDVCHDLGADGRAAELALDGGRVRVRFGQVGSWRRHTRLTQNDPTTTGHTSASW